MITKMNYYVTDTKDHKIMIYLTSDNVVLVCNAIYKIIDIKCNNIITGIESEIILDINNNDCLLLFDPVTMNQ